MPTDIGQNHEGGCVCGANRYRVTAAPARVSACSCQWCRRRTGSVLGVSVYFQEEDIEFTRQSLSTYRLTSDAGRWIDQQFCSHCGTVLTWTLEFQPGRRGIAGGTFDDPTVWGTPQRHVFARNKLDWLQLGEEIPECEGMAGS